MCLICEEARKPEGEYQRERIRAAYSYLGHLEEIERNERVKGWYAPGEARALKNYWKEQLKKLSFKI